MLDEWAHRRGIEIVFIRPGKPVENAYAESFNGRVREECLNQHVFDELEHARTICDAWREDYNSLRPHTSLGGLSPCELLSQHSGGHACPSAASPLLGLCSSTDHDESNYPSTQAQV